ncbi:UDP-N-acetylglucosamine 4,6-dehydratase [Streptomyces sp. 846.5]|nr:UDP-N-acetylglucosamine 4,6-dehydratase (inverting) [Streptomyces sp. 846.5]TDU04460.1 UDP-N-acetylglucosamine 4,6-dehydratase [Streptomyces sp. 846.5]
MGVLKDSSILVTGSTGTFGKAFIQQVLDRHDPARLVLYSRDELKQFEARQLFRNDPRLQWVLGDVRDRERLAYAMRGVDIVVHAAALKQVDTAESNPYEFVKTNILGSQNVIDAAFATGVRKVLALSTDKACRPINLYGGTKLVADKLFISANHGSASQGTAFSVVRYGNVLGSRGSVVPYFRALARQGMSLPITDKRMTRFWITLEQAVRFVVESLDPMQGGELYVPRIPSMRIVDLAEAVAPGALMHEVGIRPGEKLHEEMICADDSERVIRLDDRYVIEPIAPSWDYRRPEAAVTVPGGFSYRSEENDQWLGVEQLQSLLSESPVKEPVTA